MKLNKLGRQKKEIVPRSRQSMQKLYYLFNEFDSAGFSAVGTLISVSAVPQYGV